MKSNRKVKNGLEGKSSQSKRRGRRSPEKRMTFKEAKAHVFDVYQDVLKKLAQ